MRRRLVRTIMAVTLLAIIVLALPLAIVVRSLYSGQLEQQLVDDAATAATMVPATPLGAADPPEVPRVDDGAHVAIYSQAGTRLAGDGPSVADAPTRAALGGHVGSATTADELVAAVPIGAQEQVVAVARAALPRSAVDDRAHRAWLVMAAIAAAAVGVAGAVAWVQARRLSRPLDGLTEAAVRLGDGDFSVLVADSGVAEIDTVAHAVNGTAARLRMVLDRERAFSADASHQLRTPLTALRLRLEAMLVTADAPGRSRLQPLLAEVDRLERTVGDLLRLSRDAPGDRVEVDMARLLGDAEERWRRRLLASGRRLELDTPAGLGTVAVSRSALTQIVEVLVDNAMVHGGGTVTVAVREVAGGLAVDVADQGAGLGERGERVFERRRSGGEGSGIGLALARSLAEAEGGRLVVVESGRNPRLRLLLARSASAGVSPPAREG